MGRSSGGLILIKTAGAGSSVDESHTAFGVGLLGDASRSLKVACGAAGIISMGSGE